MTTTFYKQLSAFALFFIALTACSFFEKMVSLSQKSPGDVYSAFKEACDSGDIATAESLVTKEGIDETMGFGVCIYMPDGIYRVVGIEGTQLVDPEPQIEISGNTAYLTWWNDSRRIEMTMYKVDNKWKIRTTMIYDQ